MTALPEPGRLLTVGDYVALGEDDVYRWELEEGKLVMTPSAEPEHNLGGLELAFQLRAQLPSDLVVITDVDVDLQLAAQDEPGTVRRPGVFVVRRTELERRKREGGVLRASGVVLAVEIVSPGSRRTDYRIKRDEYADAGIPSYWILDIAPPISLVTLRLTDDMGYADDGEFTGTFTTNSPCPLTIDLDRLV